MGSHDTDKAASSSKRDKHRDRDRDKDRSSSSSKKHRKSSDKHEKRSSKSSKDKTRIVDDDGDENNDEDLWVEKAAADAEEVRRNRLEKRSAKLKPGFLLARFHRQYPYERLSKAYFPRLSVLACPSPTPGSES